MSIANDFTGNSLPAPGASPVLILIADDDGPLRLALALVLQRHGYIVESVRNGRAALDYLLRYPVSILITDIFMPDLDGLELIGALRKAAHRPHLIAMSGGRFASQSDALNIARALGATHTLCKPFEPEQLLRCVRDVLGRGQH